MNATAEFTSIRNKKGIMTNIRVTDVLQIDEIFYVYGHRCYYNFTANNRQLK